LMEIKNISRTQPEKGGKKTDDWQGKKVGEAHSHPQKRFKVVLDHGGQPV